LQRSVEKIDDDDKKWTDEEKPPSVTSLTLPSTSHTTTATVRVTDLDKVPSATDTSCSEARKPLEQGRAQVQIAIAATGAAVDNSGIGAAALEVETDAPTTEAVVVGVAARSLRVELRSVKSHDQLAVAVAPAASPDAN